MAPPNHQAPAAVPTPALNIGAASQAMTSHNQARNITVDETEGANGVTQSQPMDQEIAQPAVATVARPTEEASVEDAALSLPTNYIQGKLSSEILLAIIAKLPDFDSLASTVMTCKRMFKLFLQHQELVQGQLLRHNGQGFLGRPEATVALKFPVIDKEAVRNINNLIKAMRVFWGDQPGVSDIPSPYEGIIASILRAQGQAPAAPTTALYQDLQVLRQESTSHLLFAAPSSAQVGNNTPAIQIVQTRWRIDRAASDLTIAQAREMAKLGVCVEKLCTRYLGGPGNHGTSSAVRDRLWLFETFCRFFGGPRYWKRWQDSIHLPAIVSAFEKSGRDKSAFEAVHDFLRLSVEAKWFAATAGTLRCRCPGGPRGGPIPLPNFCYKCYNNGVDGALCMGLAAVCRIIETPVTNMQALRDCFVWEADGLPKEHPLFLHYFFNEKERSAWI